MGFIELSTDQSAAAFDEAAACLAQGGVVAGTAGAKIWTAWP
jgi:hypothetical protein